MRERPTTSRSRWIRSSCCRCCACGWIRDLITVAHFVAPSLIDGSGQGFFVDQDVPRGAVLVAPQHIDRVLTWNEIGSLPEGSVELRTSIRWFEDRYAANQTWTQDCFINHSFDPSAHFHLGFIFARRDLVRGAEITIDYRFFLGEGYRMPFTDGATARPIVGFSWREAMRRSAEELGRIFVDTPRSDAS